MKKLKTREEYAQALADRDGVSIDFLEGSDVDAYIAEEKAKEMERLEKYGVAVQRKIDEAIKARDASGIENRWRQDLQQYYGEDVAEDRPSNLAERAAAGDRGAGKSGERPTKSKIIVNITRPKANAVIARQADMLLPTDDKNWGIGPTPVPELADMAGNTQPALNEAGQPVIDAKTGQQATVDATVRAINDAALKASRAMERQIDDNLTECDYNGEVRKLLWYRSVLGTGVMKGPVSKAKREKVWLKGKDGVWEMQTRFTYAPGSKAVDPRFFFPDPSCGGDIRNAGYVVEWELFNSKTLRELADEEGYVKEAIKECLREKPKRNAGLTTSNRAYLRGDYDPSDTENYDIFHVYGFWSKGELADLGVDECDCSMIKGEDGKMIDNPDDSWRYDMVVGCIVQCNGRPIKAYLHPTDDEEIPYDVVVYEKVAGQVFGVGVPYILRNPQRVVTAAWRMVMDNAALASGGQIVIDDTVIHPADGVMEVRGNKIWLANGKDIDVNKAFRVFQLDSRLDHLLKIIEVGMRFAEDESSLPSLLEGNQGSAPDTVGGMTLLTNNANSVLRRLVKEFDDNITDRHITRYYNWHMQHSEDMSIKGDFQVDARGSSVLMVRDLQKQALMASGQFVLHPQLGPFHKRKGYDWLRSMYEANHITPDSILEGDDKIDGIIERMEKAASQQPQDPRIAAAQIKAAVDRQELQIDQQEGQAQRQHEIQMANLKYQTAMLDYATKSNQSLEQIKARLAEVTIKEQGADRRQERELAHAVSSPTGMGI